MSDVSEPRGAGAFGLLTIFALPFAGVGAYTGYLLLAALASGNGDAERLLLLTVFSLVFGGVGVGLIWGDRHSRAQQALQDRLRRSHPNEPWRWNPDWADGRVRGGNRTRMYFVWAFALIWNLITAPMLTQLPGEFAKGNYGALFGLLFPAAGAGLLWWAIRATIRYRRFGVSDFRLDTIPGRIGGKLSGQIETGMRTRPPGDVTVKLTSVHRYRTTGSKKETREKILWQDEYRLAESDLRQGPNGIALPVEFTIPDECKGTDEIDPGNRHLWRLEAAAQLAGVDFHTQFEVPVFVTSEPNAAAVGWPAESTVVRRERDEFDPSSSPVQITSTRAGNTEFVFPAGRNKSVALSLTVLLLIFGGATAGLAWWLRSSEQPFIFTLFTALFPVVFGLFTLLILFFALDAWFAKSRVVIADGRLSSRRTLFGSGKPREIAVADIAEIQLGIGMSQNQTATQSGKAYYDIEIHPKTGKRFKAGQGIPNKREAEWIAKQMREMTAA
ncbi:MAG: hypothetical protein GKS06_20010 [Acidobacteria bacterium]|nr:hypothetical protein [Acidobacteriota bacterium]